MSSRRGPDLPYSVVAGLSPCSTGWLAATAKIQGGTFAPEPPKVYDTFLEALNERPSFVAVVVNAPVGFMDGPSMEPRRCDLEVRAMLKRRGSTVHNAPTYAILDGTVSWRDGGLDAISASMLTKYREVATEMSPFRQRVVYEGHPELSFYQLQQDTPLCRSKNVEMGREERLEVLRAKMPGVDTIVEAKLNGVAPKHLYDACALLWTARRVYGKAAKRIPIDPVWDSEGMRMEIVY